MNCDCIQKTAEMMAIHYTDQAGEGTTAECQNMAINFGTGGLSLMIPYTVRGSKGAKFRSAKGNLVNVLATYCPLCGKSTKPEVRPATEQKD